MFRREKKLIVVVVVCMLFSGSYLVLLLHSIHGCSNADSIKYLDSLVRSMMYLMEINSKMHG